MENKQKNNLNELIENVFVDINELYENDKVSDSDALTSMIAMKIHIVKKMVIIEHHDLVDEIRIRFGAKIREWFSDDIGRNQLIDCCLLNQMTLKEKIDNGGDELDQLCDPNEAMIQVCEEISCDPKFKKDYFDLETNMSCTEYRLCIDEGWRLSELENYGLDDSLFKLTNCDCGDGNGVLPHHCDCKDEDKETPTNFDAVQSLDLIWEKLHSYRGFDNDECSVKDEEWDEICTSMSWIEDECGLERKEGVLVPKEKDEDKVLATRHNDNEVIDVTLTENEAFDEGYRQGKDENKVDMETDILSNIIHKNMIFSTQEDQPTWGHTDKEKIANMDETINEIVDYICKSSIEKPKPRIRKSSDEPKNKILSFEEFIETRRFVEGYDCGGSMDKVDAFLYTKYDCYIERISDFDLEDDADVKEKYSLWVYKECTTSNNLYELERILYNEYYLEDICGIYDNSELDKYLQRHYIKPLFLCCWNNEKTEIHTKESLYKEYSDLAPNGENYNLSWWTCEFRTFDDMLDSLKPLRLFSTENNFNFHSKVTPSSFYEVDNMEIRRVR